MTHHSFDWDRGDDIDDLFCEIERSCPSGEDDPLKGLSGMRNIINRGGASKEPTLDIHNIGSTSLSESPLCFVGTHIPVTRSKTEVIPPLLFDLLSKGTPHGSEKDLLEIMKASTSAKLEVDKFGNVWTIVGKDESPETMFSCHMDTVHKHAWPIQLFKTGGTLPKDKHDFIFAARVRDKDEKKPETEETLRVCNSGADDKVGIYIMIRLINAKIPGLYMFHVGEECGGIGSRGVVKDLFATETRFKKLKRAIAFDRKDYNDIITSQSCGVCCSTEFATALAGMFNESVAKLTKNPVVAPRFKWGPDGGTFTDTASYAGLIPECTNLSIGYFNQHTPTEHFDPVWLETIAIPMFKAAKWHELPTVRDPAKKHTWTNHYDTDDYAYGNYGRRINSTTSDLLSWDKINLDTNDNLVPTLPLSITAISVMPGPSAIFKSVCKTWKQPKTTIRDIAQFVETAAFHYFYQKNEAETFKRRVEVLEDLLKANGIEEPKVPLATTKYLPVIIVDGPEDKKAMIHSAGLRQGVGQHELPQAFSDEKDELFQELYTLHSIIEMGDKMGVCKANHIWVGDIKSIMEIFEQVKLDVDHYETTFMSTNMADKRTIIGRIQSNLGVARTEIQGLDSEVTASISLGDMNAIKSVMIEARPPLEPIKVIAQDNVIPLIPHRVVDTELQFKVDRLPQSLQKVLNEVDKSLMLYNSYTDKAANISDPDKFPAKNHMNTMAIHHKKTATEVMVKTMRVDKSTPKDIKEVLRAFAANRFPNTDSAMFYHKKVVSRDINS